MVHRQALGASAIALIALLGAGCGSGGTSYTAAGGSPAGTATTAAVAAAHAPSASAGASGVVVATKHARLGTILAVGGKRMTAYLFEADRGPASTCSGACARVWPPVTTAGTPTARGGASARDLGTITRSDGRKQVTYKGRPLYLYAKDKDDGDAYGQGLDSFGAGWYVLSPTGAKVESGSGKGSGRS